VATDHERLVAEFPSLVWTAGKSMPFTIGFESSGKASIKPRWRVWARPLGVPRYLEWPLKDGQLQVPADRAGLYVLKVSPETQDWRMLFGDYGGFAPGGTLWDSTENAAAHVRRSQKLSLNLFVERLGHPGAGLSGAWIWSNNADGIVAVNALKERLEKDPLG